MSASAGVAAGNPQTAEAGASLLRAGGNAVDAAVGAAFASWVCEPPLGSAAGGAVLLYGSPQAGFTMMDGFSPVPGLGRDPSSKLDFQPIHVDYGPTGQTFWAGRASAAVPTALPALLAAHKESGRLPLADVLAPATRLAREGWVVAEALSEIMHMLSPILTLTPEVAALHCEHGKVATAGARLTNEAFAGFLDQLSAEGATAAMGDFYSAVAAAFGPAQGGLITEADLRAWRPQRRSPLSLPFLDTTILLNPPPSAGGALIALALTAFERPAQPGFGAHSLRALAAALGVSSRARKAGFDNLVTDLDAKLDPATLADWAKRPGIAAAERPLGSTTHISVVDASGGAASLTMSNGEGCGHLVPGYGVHMNNFLGEEDINPRGWHTDPPGTLMSTMMCPTIVLREGKVCYVLGTGGANRIRSAITQSLANHLAQGLSGLDAVNVARVHVEADHVWLEDGGLTPEQIRDATCDFDAHTTFSGRNMFFGGVHGLTVDAGVVASAVDRRRGGVFVPVTGA